MTKSKATKRSYSIEKDDNDLPIKNSDGKIVSKPKRKQYDLMSLLRFQDFHGYWEDLNEINTMLGSNISSIHDVDVKPAELAKKCIVTILAIAAAREI